MRGATQATAPGQRAGELEQFKRLVALQRQIVELARSNAQVEQECGVLWKELVWEMSRRRRRFVFRRAMLAVRGAFRQPLARCSSRDSGSAWCLLRPPADPTSV